MLNIPVFRNYQLGLQTKQNKINNTIKYNNLAPLKADTVSFGASRKLNKSLLEAFDNKKACQSVHENADVAMEHLREILNESLGEFIFDEQQNPSGCIEKIEGRIKSPHSIREKVANALEESITTSPYVSFDPNSEKEIKKKCSDIIGARIILERSTQNEGAKIIDKLIEQIEKGELKIIKIQHHVSPDANKSLNYFSDKDLKRLENAANKAKAPHLPEIKIAHKKSSGYMALHIDVDLSYPDFQVKNSGYKGEIQIIGSDVAKLKDVEDLCYKLKDEKILRGGHFSYEPFSKYFKDALGEEQAKTLKYFNEYTRRAYKIQREKTPDSLNTDKLPTIKECSMEGLVPPKLDFNNLEKINQCCKTIYNLSMAQ